MKTLMLNVIIFFSVGLPPNCLDSKTIKILSNHFNCYECQNKELDILVNEAKQRNCIYTVLTKTLYNGASEATIKQYELSIRETYSVINKSVEPLTADTLTKKHSFKATEDEIVKIYLADQKASYQIRSIEPMFQIDKNKTISIIKDFIKKAENNPSFARENVVKYAEGRLNYYSKLK